MITLKKVVMGMPATVTIIDADAKRADIEEVFKYFRKIDKQFSTYKKESEVEKINRDEITSRHYSKAMKKILQLSEKTKKDTNGYFDVFFKGKFDPSGIVKGYAIHQGSLMLKKAGYKNYYVEIAGDIDVHGKNQEGKPWSVGIRNPFKTSEIVKILKISNKGVATSGNYIRGEHIYNPVEGTRPSQIASITVIGPNVYEADRMATAAYAMGKQGIQFIESQANLEGYMIDNNKQATFTSGLEEYVASP